MFRKRRKSRRYKGLYTFQSIRRKKNRRNLISNSSSRKRNVKIFS